MFTYEIKNDKIIDDVLKYIYENKFCIYNRGDLNCLVMRFKNENPDIFMGYGEYHFLFNEKFIDVNYGEENVPRYGGKCIDYFKRLILKCDTEETLYDFLKKAVKTDNSNDFIKKTNIYITNEYGEWFIYNKIPSRKIESVYLDNDIVNKIITDMDVFKKSEDEYNNFGIPYKRTYLLTGPPGVGKTSLIKAICGKYDYSLSMISVSKNFDNCSLIHAFKEIEDNTILLLEDIDSLFEKRQSTSDNPSLTFSNLINILDGVLYKHGIIIFMTTNHPEKLDSALLRIGRIDLILQIDFPSKNNIYKVFVDLLKNKYDKNKINKKYSIFYDNIKNKKIPMCAIVNFLFRYREEWEKNINELLETNIFIKKTLMENRDENFYT